MELRTLVIGFALPIKNTMSRDSWETSNSSPKTNYLDSPDTKWMLTIFWNRIKIGNNATRKVMARWALQVGLVGLWAGLVQPRDYIKTLGAWNKKKKVTEALEEWRSLSLVSSFLPRFLSPLENNGRNEDASRRVKMDCAREHRTG